MKLPPPIIELHALPPVLYNVGILATTKNLISVTYKGPYVDKCCGQYYLKYERDYSY